MKHIYRVHFQLPIGHRTYNDYKTRKTAMIHYGNKGFMAKLGWKSLRIEIDPSKRHSMYCNEINDNSAKEICICSNIQ